MTLSLSFSIMKPIFVLVVASLLGCIKGCVEKERRALVDFKTSFASFPQNQGKLTSWNSTKEASDCCTWEGITCDSHTLHVISLSLLNFDPTKLSIGSFQWLSHLSSLESLHMHSVNLSGARDWLSVIRNLPLLSDFVCNTCYFPIPDISSTFPNHLNSSSSLQTLDLASSIMSSSALSLLINSTWNNLSYLDLGHLNLQGPFPNISFDHIALVSLETLVLNGIYLQEGDFKSIGSICSLKVLHASRCGIKESINDVLQALASCASGSLEVLDLSSNNLTGTIPFMLKFPSLTDLYLSDNHLDKLSTVNSKGPFPDVSHGMISLQRLTIAGNRLDGGTLKSIGSICSLKVLDASECSIEESIADVLEALTSCASGSLETLDLSGNNLTGTIPPMLEFGSLSELHLDHNRLEGFELRNSSSFLKPQPSSTSSRNFTISTLPLFPPNLSSLYMSHNTLNGLLSQEHFTNLPLLMELDLSNNPNLTVSFTELGVYSLLLSSCNLGPGFPNWLLALTNIAVLDISHSKIAGSIPIMFWLKFPPTLVDFNLSFNNLDGTIPNIPIKFGGLGVFTLIIDLSSNLLYGPIPFSFFQADLLDLSQNKFSSFAPIPHSYNLSFLHPSHGRHNTSNILDISDNNLSGEIPHWLWLQMSMFNTLNLANNKLSGSVQSSAEYPLNLYVLNLRNNSFFGPLPSLLKNCTNLRILDLSLNKFSGLLPSWFGEGLKNLAVLSLQSNNFTGTLPANLCLLSSLQILDLSDNKLLGNIPSCSFAAMTHQVNLSEQIQMPSDDGYFMSAIGEAEFYHAFIKWKGMDRLFQKNLQLYTLIDLSKNNFSGEIPTKLTSLLLLDSLDLSGNNFHGSIPAKMGQLKSLEYLNLSCNKLSGPIPESLSEISSLGMLDLSHNNLSGRIPKGTQLQGFNSSAFADNPELCGLPLQIKCPGDVDGSAKALQPSGQDGSEKEDDWANKQWFYAGLGMGFAFGFLGILGTLTWIRKWRYAFFNFATQLGEWILLSVAMSRTKIYRKFQFK